MRLECTIPGPPVPKQRARCGKGGRWYTPTATRRYEAHVRGVMRWRLFATNMNPGSTWPLDARYAVTARICWPDARRRDGDNALKSLLDAGNTLLWKDDSQVTSHLVTTEIDRANPRVELTVEVLA